MLVAMPTRDVPDVPRPMPVETRHDTTQSPGAQDAPRLQMQDDTTQSQDVQDVLRQTAQRERKIVATL